MSLIEQYHAIEARSSFYAYRIFINKKLKKGWWQKEIARQLQQFWNDYKAGLRPKLVIQAPPQHGKSTQIVDFITWMIGQEPELRTIYASFSDRLGVRANSKIKKILASDKYKLVFPDVVIGTPYTQEIVGINDEGFFRNTTVGGQITGESLDIGVIDDPIKGREAANSETIRDKTWEWFTDDFSTRFADDGALLCILTRWHVDDPIGRLLAQDKAVKVLTYPAIATQDEPNRKKGEPLFPEHKSVEFLATIEARMQPASWNSLYQQNPTIEDGNLFKPDNIETIESLPWGHITWVRAWDLASTTDGDYTAGAKLGKLRDGRFVIADMYRDRVGPDDRDAAIVNTAKRDTKKTKVGIPQDPGQAGKTQVLYLTRKLAGFKVKSSPESGDKVTRAEPFASQVNVGNVLMLEGDWNNELIKEMRLFPNGKYDDQIDALSRAFMELMTSNSLNITDEMVRRA